MGNPSVPAKFLVLSADEERAILLDTGSSIDPQALAGIWVYQKAQGLGGDNAVAVLRAGPGGGASLTLDEATAFPGSGVVIETGWNGPRVRVGTSVANREAVLIDGNDCEIRLGGNAAKGGVIKVMDGGSGIGVRVVGDKGFISLGNDSQDGDLQVHDGRGGVAVSIDGSKSRLDVGAGSGAGKVYVTEQVCVSKGTTEASEGVFVYSRGLLKVVVDGNSDPSHTGSLRARPAIVVQNSRGESIAMVMDNGAMQLGGNGYDGVLHIKDRDGVSRIILDGRTGKIETNPV